MRRENILTERCDIVIDALPSHEQWVLNHCRSQFSEELRAIQSKERREWLETYVLDSAFFLLHGIIDQIYKLDSCIHTQSRAAVDVTEQILNRTILEYYGNLCYLVDLIPDADATERTKRAIRLAYVDLLEYDRQPARLQSQNRPDRKPFLIHWYKEITNGEELPRYITRSTFEVIEEETKDRPWSRNKRQNRLSPLYESGYQVHSKIVHGNLWAIKHYGTTKADSEKSGNIRLPGVDRRTKLVWADLSGRILQSSYGLTMQFMGSTSPYIGTMNQLTPYLDQIHQMILSLDSQGSMTLG